MRAVQAKARARDHQARVFVARGLEPADHRNRRRLLFRRSGNPAGVMTLFLAPLLPFIALALLLGAERLERGLDGPPKRGKPRVVS